MSRTITAPLPNAMNSKPMSSHTNIESHSFTLHESSRTDGLFNWNLQPRDAVKPPAIQEEDRRRATRLGSADPVPYSSEIGEDYLRTDDRRFNVHIRPPPTKASARLVGSGTTPS